MGYRRGTGRTRRGDGGDYEIPKPPMKTSTKIMIAAGLTVGLSCIGCFILAGPIMGALGRAVGGSIITDDPAQLAAEGSEVIDYTLPLAYRELGSVNFLVGKLIFIGAGSIQEPDPSRPFIMIMSFPLGTGMETEQFRQNADFSSIGGAQNQNMNLTLVNQQLANIRGQVVNLYVYEGRDGEGVLFRQVVSEPFDAKSGQAMIMIMGPAFGWNEAEINSFIASLR